jgi:hypothetical protein
MGTYIVSWIISQKEKLEKKKSKIGKKINRKTNVIFWNFKDPKNGKMGWGGDFRTNIIKEKNSFSI